MPDSSHHLVAPFLSLCLRNFRWRKQDAHHSTCTAVLTDSGADRSDGKGMTPWGGRWESNPNRTETKELLPGAGDSKSANRAYLGGGCTQNGPRLQRIEIERLGMQ